MKLVLATLALIAVVNASIPSDEYLPPVDNFSSGLDVQSGEASLLSDDGYRYKTIRRLRHRHRRDVNELPSGEYLPPTQVDFNAQAPTSEYLAPVESHVSPSHLLTDEGYRYKTVRRLRHRHRRDVSDLLSGEYLPPTENYGDVYAQEGAPAALLGSDGYRYKTIRKYRTHRH